MKFIKLTTTPPNRDVLLNPEHISFIKKCTSTMGDDYCEIVCLKEKVEVKETIEEIKEKLKGYENNKGVIGFHSNKN